MATIIIYPQEDNRIVLVYPTGEIPLLEVARKDVPAGVPYKFVERENLPEDMTFFEAWEADFSSPDGYGIGADAWFAEQAAKEQQ